MLRHSQSELDNETAAARPQFDELLDLANETMLSDPSVFDKHYAAIDARTPSPSSAHQESAQSLGLWIVSRLLDEGVESTEINTDLVETIEGSSRYLLPFETDIQNRIEALGKAILDEAFDCLGAEAPQYVSKFQQAQTDNERYAACDWLTTRIYEISKMAHENHGTVQEVQVAATLDQGTLNTADDEHFYHPGRLSPKFIGIFPNIQIEPTCLGYSILAASFFEKAGVPYIHSGVARTAKEEARDIQSRILQLICRVAKDTAIPLPSHLEESFADTFSKNKADYGRHTDFHAAVLSRLSEEIWMQLDHNYSSNFFLTGMSAEKATDDYEALRSRNNVARGLEYDFTPDVAMPINRIYRAAAFTLLDQLAAVENIDGFLRTIPTAVAEPMIIGEYFGDFLDDSDTGAGRFLDYCARAYCQTSNTMPNEVLRNEVHNALVRHVFSDSKDGDIRPCIERCHIDPAYRRRRAEDLVFAPLFAVLGMQSRHANMIINDEIILPHNVLEGGLPAYRIGASVLSDLAVYCGDELPLSFWMTYWPSNVCFAEHYKNSHTTAQKQLRQQLKADLLEESHQLKYGFLYGIIDNVHE